MLSTAQLHDIETHIRDAEILIAWLSAPNRSSTPGIFAGFTRPPLRVHQLVYPESSSATSS